MPKPAAGMVQCHPVAGQSRIENGGNHPRDRFWNKTSYMVL
jgi:hypothetical protein